MSIPARIPKTMAEADSAMREVEVVHAPTVTAPDEFPFRAACARRYWGLAGIEREAPQRELDDITASLRANCRTLSGGMELHAFNRRAEKIRNDTEYVPAKFTRPYEQFATGEVGLVPKSELDLIIIPDGFGHAATAGEYKTENDRLAYLQKRSAHIRSFRRGWSKRRKWIRTASKVHRYAYSSAQRWSAWIKVLHRGSEPDTGRSPLPQGRGEACGLDRGHRPEVVERFWSMWTVWSSVHDVGDEWPPDFPAHRAESLRTTYFGDALIDPTRSPRDKSVRIYPIPGENGRALVRGPHENGTLWVILETRAAWPINLKPQTAHLHPGLIDGVEAVQMWGQQWRQN